ncbi:hypothetical protein EEL49_06720 [Muribaculaceae bacterium Isolate-104 (HZI)]|nr:hypothetical protein EEL49_06720 [Muribaculaceae bacterium Isolate-104 (HZI)]
MKKHFLAVAALAAPMMMFGQSALDAFNISQPDFRGTARFMSMGGAFTALGGDLSTLNQNPGGLGVYRSSEIGLTLDLNFTGTKSLTQGYQESVSKTRFNCNNFGYIGAVYTGSDIMPYFNWGVSYSRSASFDRAYKGKIGQLNGSLTNYIAGLTTSEGWTTGDLSGNNTYNPYQESLAPWTSIIAYNAYMISPIGSSNKDYTGMWDSNSSGYGTFDVRDKGYIDEYSINFGGNFSDIVFWGMGFGITDVEYRSSVYYTEDYDNAIIPAAPVASGEYTGTTSGAGGFGLDSWKHISGTGFNFKFGLIIKPINALRLGLAVHTPTYYNLKQEGWAGVDYGYSSGINGYTDTNDGYTDYFEWKLRSPWRLMAGVSGVIGKKAILSADYEYRPMQKMGVKDYNNNEYTDINGDISTYYKATSIFRLGAEYRLNQNWSLRAGYQLQTSPSTEAAIEGNTMIFTSGPDDTETTPSYSFDRSTHYISCGLGYRYKNFYVDAAYVNKFRESSWRAYTPNNYTALAPSSKITESKNQIVLSAGFKF